MNTSVGKLLGDARELRACLSVSLPEDHPCPLNETCPCVTDVEQTTVAGECHLITKAAPEEAEGEAVLHVTSDVDDAACFCSAFTQHDSVAVIRDRKEGEVTIETYPPDRVALMELVGELSELADVEVRQLSLLENGSSEVCNRESVNLSQLTELERETVRWAIEHGYYEDPRRIGLDELAEEFDVSKSSISQRLQSAERKLVSQAIG
ncbi:MAG: helix-turn-helix domain-containing protein [Haloferacaceae archaeon]